MIKPKAKKNISDLTFYSLFLVLVKESYLFVRNLYGLLFHPFKTIVSLRQKPDKSQTLLIFGLPFYLFLGGVILFLPFFWVSRNWYNARILSLLFFYSFTLLLFFIGCYLLYCLWQYYRKCKLKPKF